MIYVVIAAVLGYAAWQLVRLFRRTRSGGCAAGCDQCNACALGQNAGQFQNSARKSFIQLDEIPLDPGKRE
ncbi:FeoB-associated Cys-rich membrane protein [Kyrpidia tusciae]|uniref:FeoB-associated Cys-rich membrane protein n=1 Tax=Kyrpidia tusciae (strain DSM 2912 / NBRC 15312 / T2) TaxID=562970 RepID=D5WTK1_KYRT2|nr:FeoB-associated Cys-rich membrane protein [Kyrpidia tusciae]ADG07237.1 hypothetical protein Btus_2580 [Kyrpidia tusciae DSM 2912]